MSFLLDLTETPESKGFEPIPAGPYTVVLDEAEIKETKAGTGEYINCKFRITAGEYENRILFHGFNIKNPNEKAVMIGMQQLKSFMKCAGAKDFKLETVSDLVGYIAIAIVKIQKDDFSPDGKSVISYFKPTPAEDKNQDIPF